MFQLGPRAGWLQTRGQSDSSGIFLQHCQTAHHRKMCATDPIGIPHPLSPLGFAHQAFTSSAFFCTQAVCHCFLGERLPASAGGQGSHRLLPLHPALCPEHRLTCQCILVTHTSWVPFLAYFRGAKKRETKTGSC